MCTRFILSASWPAALAVALSACGGGGDDGDLALAIDQGHSISTAYSTIVFTGEASVPAGSTCPKSNDYIVIGSLGPHEMSYRNAANGAEGPLFDVLWICNSEGGKVMHWQSNPLDLVPGANPFTVTMKAGGRQATETVTVTRTHP